MRQKFCVSKSLFVLFVFLVVFLGIYLFFSSKIQNSKQILRSQAQIFPSPIPPDSEEIVSRLVEGYMREFEPDIEQDISSYLTKDGYLKDNFGKKTHVTGAVLKMFMGGFVAQSIAKGVLVNMPLNGVAASYTVIDKFNPNAPDVKQVGVARMWGTTVYYQAATETTPARFAKVFPLNDLKGRYLLSLSAYEKLQAARAIPEIAAAGFLPQEFALVDVVGLPNYKALITSDVGITLEDLVNSGLLVKEDTRRILLAFNDKVLEKLAANGLLPFDADYPHNIAINDPDLMAFWKTMKKPNKDMAALARFYEKLRAPSGANIAFGYFDFDFDTVISSRMLQDYARRKASGYAFQNMDVPTILGYMNEGNVVGTEIDIPDKKGNIRKTTLYISKRELKDVFGREIVDESDAAMRSIQKEMNQVLKGSYTEGKPITIKVKDGFMSKENELSFITPRGLKIDPGTVGVPKTTVKQPLKLPPALAASSFVRYGVKFFNLINNILMTYAIVTTYREHAYSPYVTFNVATEMSGPIGVQGISYVDVSFNPVTVGDRIIEKKDNISYAAAIGENVQGAWNNQYWEGASRVFPGWEQDSSEDLKLYYLIPKFKEYVDTNYNVRVTPPAQKIEMNNSLTLVEFEKPIFKRIARETVAPFSIVAGLGQLTDTQFHNTFISAIERDDSGKPIRTVQIFQLIHAQAAGDPSTTEDDVSEHIELMLSISYDPDTKEIISFQKSNSNTLRVCGNYQCDEKTFEYQCGPNTLSFDPVNKTIKWSRCPLVRFRPN